MFDMFFVVSDTWSACHLNRTEFIRMHVHY